MAKQGLWADGRLRAAYAAQDWPLVFRRYRALSGLSQNRLGRLVGLTQAYVSRIESGRPPQAADVIARIVEGLEVPEELGGSQSAAKRDDWAPAAELRERMAHASRTGRADMGTADWISTVLAQYRRAEDDVRGPALWPVVRAQLDTVTELLPKATANQADRLLLLAAEHAHWLSWVAWQEGRRGPALAWLDLAAGCATDGGHVDMASWVGRVRAYYTLEHGDPLRSLRTADAARFSSAPLSPAAAAAAAYQTGLAAAAVSERDRARRLADEAREFAEQVPDEADRPDWLYWLTPARADLQVADIAFACRDWAAAAEGFRQALPGLVGYPRDHAYYQARMEDARRRI
ncbi:helix-turn-helix domain-containing protein [Streptomyces sp. SCSIO ZS0520]|uniref:helix-turn-helix domain-containing protein n=1 Tax=Streptomyces sp. SCSIO ZS0520 TaxID=2892996 RepID=UPI0021D9C5B8|nr:helix-turn-helix transcriptional regulator [Streptomyces sp. SCSIO ZS0520]